MSDSFKSAREFFVARQNASSNQHNTLVGPRVDVIIQTSPGIPQGTKWGVNDLEYKVFWGGTEKQSGTTSSQRDGTIRVAVCPNTSVKTELSILDSQYEIHRLDNIAPAKTLRGLQQRLSVLGYYSGELISHENVIASAKDMYDLPNVEIEKALLDFQADRDLFADGLCGPKTLSALDDELKSGARLIEVTNGVTSDYEAKKTAIGAHKKLKLTIHKYQRLCPVRFARAPHATNANAVSGPPDANAPDPDDRGFKKCLSTQYGGVLFPVGYDSDLATQSETRVKLVRENISDAAPIYVCSGNDSKLEITSPTKVANSHSAIIKFKVKTHGRCFIEVRYGSETGPVLHRMQVVINSLRTLDIKVHSPIINGFNQLNGVPIQSVFNTKAQIDARFVDVNKIYFPYGIKFDVMASIDNDVHNFFFQGGIDLGTAEGGTMRGHNRAGNGAINVIFVPQIIVTRSNGTGGRAWVIPRDRIGGAASSAVGNPNGFTVYLADWATEAQTIAHEIGHVLNLVNDPNDPRFVHSNTRDDRRNPQVPGTGVRIRDDIVSRRRLMWAFTSISTRCLREFPSIIPTVPGSPPTPTAYNFEPIMAYRNNVGYGPTKVGTMLAIKNFDQDPSDLEMQEVQKTADILIAKAGSP
jgi:hypothetical protein